MKREVILLFVAGFLLVSGCTNPLTGLPTQSPDLAMNQSAVFGQEGYEFVATLDHFTVEPTGSGAHTVSFGFTVKNTGSKGISFVAYPRIIDGTGTEYPEKGVFLGAISPGGHASGTSSVIISPDSYPALSQHAVLKIRFQEVKPIPYEVSWGIDPGTFPP